MRRKLAAVSAIALASFLMITNPVVADAARMITGSDIADNTVTSKDIKDKSLRSADFKPGELAAGPTGPAGPAGATGPTGAAGAAGATGSQGIVVTKRFGGPVGTIPTSSLWAFIGPSTTVAVAVNQSLVGSGMVPLGTSAGTATAQLDLCYQLNGAGTVANFSSGNYSAVEVDTTRTAQAVAGAVTLPTGSYKVGPCVRSASIAIDSNNYANGYVQVVNTGGTALRPADGARAE